MDLFLAVTAGATTVFVELATSGSKQNPQLQTARRAGTWTLHFGQSLNHGLRDDDLTGSSPAALRAARVFASSRATAHWGCSPVRE